jgi:hypothetical protein
MRPASPPSMGRTHSPAVLGLAPVSKKSTERSSGERSATNVQRSQERSRGGPPARRTVRLVRSALETSRHLWPSAETLCRMKESGKAWTSRTRPERLAAHSALLERLVGEAVYQTSPVRGCQSRPRHCS